MSETESKQPLEQLIANRVAKLDSLREQGCDPYPRRFRVETSISEVRGQYEGLDAEELEQAEPKVRMAGRIRAIRGHGKVSFVDLTDGATHLQLYIKKNQLDEATWLRFQQLQVHLLMLS